MSDVLKPCPYCGEKPESTYVRLYKSACWHIDCKNDECPEKPGTWYYYDMGGAVKEWNEMIAK